MSTEGLFGNNQKFKEAILTINNLDNDKFGLLISRIIKKLDVKNAALFNETELNQLQTVFDLSSADLNSVLDATSFIFEQAAYFAINPDVLALQLEKSSLIPAKARAFSQVWKEEAAEYINKLRKKTIVPLEANAINWRLHLELGQSGLVQLKEPRAIFQIGLNSNSENETKPNSSLTMEFTHSELFDFFQQLETIQEQLDNLL